MDPVAETPAPRDGAWALTLATLVSTGLALAKFLVGLLSGSMVLLASAADSLADAMLSAANRWGYRQARVPADADHPFGHGKLEGAFSVGQGMLLLGMVLTLIAGSVAELVMGHELPRVDIALAALGCSALAAVISVKPI